MEDTLKAQLKCPIAIKWTIPEHRLQELKDKPGKLNSDIFNASNIPGVKYFATIYPHDNQEGRRGEAWIYLFIWISFTNEIQLKIDDNFFIKIQSANFCKEMKHVVDYPHGWGVTCCRTDELFDPENGFIVDGKMTIRMGATLIFEKEIPMKPDFFGTNADTLGLELWKQENKDFTLLVDGREITAHKCILAARSPVFSRMFETDMKESKENTTTIEDFQFDIVEAAIKLCYHHTLVSFMTLQKKLKLLQFFDKYDIHALKVKLEEHLISEIDESNVCLLTNASLLSNARKLQEKCAEFLQDCLNSKPISDFDILDKDFAMNLLKNAFCRISK